MACLLYNPTFLVAIRPHYIPSYYPGKLLLTGISHLKKLSSLGISWSRREDYLLRQAP